MGVGERGGPDSVRITSAATQFVTVLVDTSVLINYLRGHKGAAELLEHERAAAPMQASEITRLEVLAGMRPGEEDGTRSLLSPLVWHPLDGAVAEEAGALGRRCPPTCRRPIDEPKRDSRVVSKPPSRELPELRRSMYERAGIDVDLDAERAMAQLPARKADDT